TGGAPPQPPPHPPPPHPPPRRAPPPAGYDYPATSGTLTFNQGDPFKSFPVPLTDDQASESNETVSLTLSNPTNATLGSPATATLTINNVSNPTGWATTGQFRLNDPQQAVLVPTGPAPAGPQAGDLRPVHPLDLDQSPGNTAAGSPALADSLAHQIRFTPGLHRGEQGCG